MLNKLLTAFFFFFFSGHSSIPAHPGLGFPSATFHRHRLVQPASGLLWVNAAAKEVPRGSRAFIEEEIIHFLMILKSGKIALEALLSDLPPCAVCSCAQRVVTTHMPKMLSAT